MTDHTASLKRAEQWLADYAGSWNNETPEFLLANAEITAKDVIELVAENERLRQDNQKLVEALKDNTNCRSPGSSAMSIEGHVVYQRDLRCSRCQGCHAAKVLSEIETK